MVKNLIWLEDDEFVIKQDLVLKIANALKRCSNNEELLKEFVFVLFNGKNDTKMEPLREYNEWDIVIE